MSTDYLPYKHIQTLHGVQISQATSASQLSHGRDIRITYMARKNNNNHVEEFFYTQAEARARVSWLFYKGLV